MEQVLRVVVIGGVAAGPKIAAKVMRLRPDAEVVLVEKGAFLSYAGCGLPYYISGAVKEQAQLMDTPIGVVRDAEFFRKVKNFIVHNHTEALEIDRPARRVRVRSRDDGSERWIEYDKLALATGARAVLPPIPGTDLENVFVLKQVEDAEAIKRLLDAGRAGSVVIVGGGLIGVEAAEALAAKGARVTIIELLPQILALLDWEMAKLVEKHLAAKGVQVRTDTKVEAFEGDGRVEAVVAGGERVPAEAVIVAVGVRPEVALAQAAGLAIGPTGAIEVDDRMCTSDPDIYAAGDCVEVIDLLTGRPAYVPLGSTANKQGRVAAVNICGGTDRFPGVMGSTICKVFDFAVGCTGLTERAAREQGHDVVTCLAPNPDKAHYYPTHKTLFLKLVADRTTGRILGLQAVGPGDASKRIDVAATALAAGMTADQVSKLDLCYAPPYSPAMDPLITAANVIKNKIDGHMVGISPMELKRKLDAGAPVFLLDVRSPGEYKKGRLAGSTLVPLGALRTRVEDVPRDRPVVVSCGSSLRAYEASLILRAAGIDDVQVLDGSIATWPYEVVS